MNCYNPHPQVINNITYFLFLVQLENPQVTCTFIYYYLKDPLCIPVLYWNAR